MKRRVKGILAAVAVGIAVIAAVIVIMILKHRPYDPDFDAEVKDPTYLGGGPVVLYDEGHLNTHTAKGGYKPLADLIRSDGYDLRVARQPLSAQGLDGVAILVIVLARGANDANDNDAFADAESSAIDAWVRGGGSLLLITDHWPYGAAVASLAKRFDVQMGVGMVQDPEHCDATRGDSHLVFSRQNGLLQDHPIVRGRNSTEEIQQVLTFTGGSIAGPAAAIAFLELSDAATERPPTTPQIEKHGGDVRVNMVYGEPISAKGKAQGIALELDKGRIVMLAEAGMLRAVQERGAAVGMNVPGYDNRQLAINIMHWLSRIL